MRHGYGELRFIRGDFFQGQWMHDRMHGKGVMRHYEGSVFEGFWDNGERADQKGQFGYANGLQVQRQGDYRLQEPYVKPISYLAQRAKPDEQKPNAQLPANSPRSPGDSFARATENLGTLSDDRFYSYDGPFK